jgi:hypothetical protein
VNRALSVLTCLVLVVLLVVLQRFVLSRDEQTAPVATSGRAGEAVSTDDFTIEVDETHFTTALDVSTGLDGGSEAVEANGAWVVVWATMTATHSTMRNFPAELRMKDGTTYFERGWFSDSFDRETLSPGIPQYGAFVFEVPADRMAEPSLVVTNAHTHERRLAAQAAVDLDFSTTEPSDEPTALLPPEVRTGEDSHASE